MVTAAMKSKITPWKKSYDQPRQHIKKQRHYFANKGLSSQLSSVQLLSRVQFFATPWTVAHQALLSFAISWSLLKYMSIESMMPSNHLILCSPLLLLPSIFPSIRVFSWQICGERVADFIFGPSKTTAHGNCSHEIKRHLLLGRKVMTNL